VTGPGEDDREAIDRAFADLVAGYHLTAERPDPVVRETPAPPPLERAWAEDHPLFRYQAEPQKPEPADVEEPYVPPPIPPMQRPAPLALIALVGFAFSVLVVFAASFGLPVPVWVGWTAVVSFVGAFGILVARLPRHRPPDAGDGAVL
jgi:hypothetical protein